MDKSIAFWAEQDKPREKLIDKGRGVLSDAELLAIIIGTGSGSKTAVDLARELLTLTEGDLYNFGKLQLGDLMNIKGIGEAKAVSILAALELGRRRKDNPVKKKPRIKESVQAYQLLLPYFADLWHEEFYAVFLNRANIVLGVRKISMGGTAGTYVDSKVVFKAALDLNASSIIVAHNHPSGNLSPSDQDERLTRRLKEFGLMIELPLLDHIIITDNGYFSFADNGKI